MMSQFKPQPLQAAVLRTLPVVAHTVTLGYPEPMRSTDLSIERQQIKVSFIEGRNSREVLDFNLFLSRSDIMGIR